MELKEKERIDDLEFKNLKIIQNIEGFCFGIDSVLIADFAKEIRKGSKGVDLGTGTGIISILLTAKTNLSQIIGVEIQEKVADMAKRSIELNNMQDRIKIVNCNIKEIFLSKNEKEQTETLEDSMLKKRKLIHQTLPNEDFDFIVTNPPYKKLKTGKVNENQMQYISRHEATANLEDFIKASKYLLKDKGTLYMVHRPERFADIIELMRKYKIEPKEIRFVQPNACKAPNLVLMKGVKNANAFLKVDKPLIIYKENGEYTDEILKIYDK